MLYRNTVRMFCQLADAIMIMIYSEMNYAQVCNLTRAVQSVLVECHSYNGLLIYDNSIFSIAFYT